ncbi:carnosine synthase 1 [Protopterus annectens]|uniref:carnosine synthase 1 n=1 Tax=Protopterus annectens TaxID=7888 RepID=UPI001CFBEE50|nr:carnosine synthase 1 [Protopterus annectens]XP_043940010.1 carnosine synthase 1 [Protopterus annectens]
MLPLEQYSADHPTFWKGNADQLFAALESRACLDLTSNIQAYWKRDVSLDCKAEKTEGKPSAKVMQLYDMLQYTLQESGLPETVDHSNEPRTGHTPSDLAICVLGSPAHYMSVLLEGGRQCPGDMMLCLSPSWLSKVPSDVHSGLFTLQLNKAVTFDLTGRTYIDEFSPPRQVTYFLGSGDAGVCEELDRDLECPRGSSTKLSHLITDKLFTRVILDRKQIRVPETLAFVYKPSHTYDTATKSVRVIQLSNTEGQDDFLQKEINQFLESETMEPYYKVVVNPSGWRWSGAHAVTFHLKSDKMAVLQATKTLLEKLKEDESVLIEAFCPAMRSITPIQLENYEDFGRGKIPRPVLTFRICTVVCRTPEDRPLLTKLVCGVGRADKPLQHKTFIPQTLDTTLQEWGVTDKDQRDRIYLQVKEKAEACLKAIMEMEAKLSSEQRGGHRAQTDMIGVDLLLTSSNQVVTPVVLKLNTHLCSESGAVFEFMNRHTMGESARLLVQTMVKRSQCYLMDGKNIAIIGGGAVSKMFVYESAKDYGIKIHLVDPDSNHYAVKMVESFIHYDFIDHKRDEEHAQKIVELLKERGLKLDGCISFWDDCIVLTAMVCEMLGLRTNPVSAMEIAKQKSKTHLHLIQKCREIPHWPPTYLYAVPCCHLESHADIDKAAQFMNFPAVMKLEYGAGAVGVKMVENLEQCHQHFEKISNDLREDTDYPGIGLGWGNTMLLMEYIDGTEHDVDIIIYDGKMIAYFVSDNGPTRIPYFTETAATMPSYLKLDKQAQLVTAAYQCCVGCGLTNGVFNTEMKMTPTGPKLIEINARMGGFYLRDWIKTIYSVDIMFSAFMIACSIRPIIHCSEPLCHLIGVMCVVSQHLKALKTTASSEVLRMLHDQGVIRLNQLEDEIISSEYEEPYCNVACMSKDREKARLQLISICQILGIDSTDYPVTYFLSDFK